MGIITGIKEKLKERKQSKAEQRAFNKDLRKKLLVVRRQQIEKSALIHEKKEAERIVAEKYKPKPSIFKQMMQGFGEAGKAVASSGKKQQPKATVKIRKIKKGKGKKAKYTKVITRTIREPQSQQPARNPFDEFFR
jgi:hypothetical protein